MEVFLVINGYGKLRTSTAKIAKIGRKWVTLEKNDGRFNIENWILDGGAYSSAGSCFPSEQEYNNQVELNGLWNEVILQIRYLRIPKSMTIEKIKQIKMLLELES